MKKVTMRRNSIAFRLAVIFIAAVFAQCGIMYIMLVQGGAIRKIRENAYTYFSLQVESRKGNLENQMKNIWTNFGDYPKMISRQFDQCRGEELSEEEENNRALIDSAPYLLEVLNNTKTTGVFLILDDVKEDKNQHSAIYIRNTDVEMAGENNFTLSLMAGPIDIARDYKLSTSEKWSWDLQLNDKNNDFYEKAYQNIGLNADERLLSYWSLPFHLTEGDEKVLAYSMPLVDENGQPIGVFGVEISESQLYKFLPKSDFSTNSSLGYILGMKETQEGPIFPVTARGAMQERLLDFTKPLEMVPINTDLDIYEIENLNSSEKFFGSFKQMGMYYNNTPFSNQEWYLIGLEEGSQLLQFSENIVAIMVFSLAVTVLFGIVVAILSSRFFSLPVIRLAKEVRNLSQSELSEEKLTGTGLAEIDELSEAIMSAQRRMMELNTKLKYDRDRDSLTGIRNRHAFNIEKEYYYQKKEEFKKLGMGIFDLNGLKYVNDNFGHKEGDRYLCEVSSSICGVFKECPVFRMGGDEFAIIITDMEHKEIENKYAKLCELLAKNERKKIFKGGVAFGYAFFDPDKDSGLEQVINRADKRMYERKKRMKELD